MNDRWQEIRCDECNQLTLNRFAVGKYCPVCKTVFLNNEYSTPDQNS